jgi:hypothetical protein
MSGTMERNQTEQSMKLERCPEAPARRMVGNGSAMISGFGHWSFDYDAMGNTSPRRAQPVVRRQRVCFLVQPFCARG